MFGSVATPVELREYIRVEVGPLWGGAVGAAVGAMCSGFAVLIFPAFPSPLQRLANSTQVMLIPD